MDSPEGGHLAENLAHRIGKGASAEHVAAEIVSTWEAIDKVLSPIIGHVGVAALYRRSVYLTTASYPWLSETRQGVHANIDLASLKAVLAARSRSDAAAGGSALLKAFTELLTTLMGSPLTERLLRPVWANSATGPSGQESSQ